MAAIVTYLYRPDPVKIFEVGYYTPGGRWMAESAHQTPDGARARIRWLHQRQLDVIQEQANKEVKP